LEVVWSAGLVDCDWIGDVDGLWLISVRNLGDCVDCCVSIAVVKRRSLSCAFIMQSSRAIVWPAAPHPSFSRALSTSGVAGLGEPFVMRNEPSLKAPMDRYLSSHGVTARVTESESRMGSGIDMMPLLYDSTDCFRDRPGVGGRLWRALGRGGGGGGMSRIELDRVATPGVRMVDRLRTGMYKETSEFVRVIGALGVCAGFELFHVVSVTAGALLSDIVAACSNWGSSAKLSRRFASYEVKS
jgi:hypothetical protein